jgi:hypothetical protein
MLTKALPAGPAVTPARRACCVVHGTFIVYLASVICPLAPTTMATGAFAQLPAASVLARLMSGPCASDTAQLSPR